MTTAGRFGDPDVTVYYMHVQCPPKKEAQR